jgi:Domain of unknown function (DUF1843)
MASRVYGDAIREVVARGELREMKQVLVRAQQLQKEQGDLPTAIARLQKAIGKMEGRATRKK